MSTRMLRWIAASVTSLILALTVGTAAYAQEPTITRLADGNYQITQDGSALTGWQTVDGRPFYLDSNGIQHIGWLEIDGARYYWDQDGTMARGGYWYTGQLNSWFDAQTQDPDSWFLFDESGKLITGESGWYYSASDGAWVLLKDEADGSLVPYGWVQSQDSSYFISMCKRASREWMTINGKEYYFTDSGAMATGTVTINGTRYTFASSGKLL